jgi:phosphopentomutase
MIDSGYNFLSHQEVSYFEKLFEEFKPEKDNNIRFSEMKEISMNYGKFNRVVTAETLERLKRLKDRQSNMNDNEILVSKKKF